MNFISSVEAYLGMPFSSIVRDILIVTLCIIVSISEKKLSAKSSLMSLAFRESSNVMSSGFKDGLSQIDVTKTELERRLIEATEASEARIEEKTDDAVKKLEEATETIVELNKENSRLKEAIKILCEEDDV